MKHRNNMPSPYTRYEKTPHKYPAWCFAEKGVFPPLPEELRRDLRRNYVKRYGSIVRFPRSIRE